MRNRYVKVVKDKTTNESKGVAYIKFTKASAAALAIELLNGKQIQDDTVIQQLLFVVNAEIGSLESYDCRCQGISKCNKNYI